MWRVCGVVILGVMLGCGSDDGAAGVDLVLDMRASGGNTFDGTFRVPEPLAPGTALQIAISQRAQGSPECWTANLIDSGSLDRETDTVLFRVRNIRSGTWALFLRADRDGNGVFGVGDVGGWYTATGTALSGDEADTFDVPSEVGAGLEIVGDTIAVSNCGGSPVDAGTDAMTRD
ncbi:MAG: hypothetical protein AAGF12_42510 [Myxococcota bacterium]